MTSKRDFLKMMAAATTAAIGLPGCAAISGRKRPHVVVVGGGYGGATAAKYLRMWSNGKVEVTLVERQASFVSCPISNLVIAGVRTLDQITRSYAQLASRWGVRVVNDEALAVDVAKRELRLARGDTLSYDRVVLSPGVDLLPEEVAGLPGAEELIPHAWKAGPQTMLLRRQLEAMPDGGIYALHIPKAPYRCPPGPYERACVVADYFRRHKPRSKVLVLDSNPEIVSKKALFQQVFAEQYRDIVEYRPNSTLLSVDANQRTAELDFENVRADVLNVVPPMRAGRLIDSLGLPLINGRWVDIDWLTMEAKGAPNVHVLGDAIFPAATMPKSGHMANQHAKHAAAVILNLLAGEAPGKQAVVMNTCYSFVDARKVIHIASVHRYDPDKNTFLPVAGAGGVSTAPSEEEGHYALAWAENIWADMLA